MTAWSPDQATTLRPGARMIGSMGAPRRPVVLAIILIGYLLVLIDVSILMVALPRIHQDLGFSAAGLSWTQNAYTLTFGGGLLLGARVGDLLGRRRTFTLGVGDSWSRRWGWGSPSPRRG